MTVHPKGSDAVYNVSYISVSGVHAYTQLWERITYSREKKMTSSCFAFAFALGLFLFLSFYI